MTQQRRVAIIGGGFVGLTAAYRLVRRGHAVTVFERSHQLGGLTMTYELLGTRLEKYYHHLFTSDRDILELADEFGVEVLWPSPLAGMFHRGRSYPFTTPGDLLRFDPLPLHDRVRLGAVMFFLQRFPYGRMFEQVTAVDWFRRYVGPRAFDAIIRPMLGAKFERNADKVAMVWMWGKMRLRGTSRGKAGTRESLGYIRGSFESLITRLADETRRLGGELQPGHVVRRIDGGAPSSHLTNLKLPGFLSDLRPPAAREAASNEWTRHRGERLAIISDRGRFEFDAVLSTLAPSLLAELAPQLPPHWRAAAHGLQYSGILCTTLVLKRRLSPFYWTWISDPAVPFSGTIEHTNYIPPQEYANRHILYISHYTYPDEEIFRMSSRGVMDRYVPHLQRINPAFDENWIEKRIFARDCFAQPIVGVNYADRVLPYVTPIPGLFSAGMAQLFPEDRGTNYAVRSGNQVAPLIDDYLSAAVADR